MASWLDLVCHDCDAKVGELHELGCDMERCPVCTDPHQQLISCSQEHFDMVEAGKVARIPYIQPLVSCGTCGEIFPDFFKVSDDDWKKYVIPPLQKEVLCRPCYKKMKNLFPQGWRAVQK